MQTQNIKPASSVSLKLKRPRSNFVCIASYMSLMSYSLRMNYLSPPPQILLDTRIQVKASVSFMLLLNLVWYHFYLFMPSKAFWAYVTRIIKYLDTNYTTLIVPLLSTKNCAFNSGRRGFICQSHWENVIMITLPHWNISSWGVRRSVVEWV